MALAKNLQPQKRSKSKIKLPKITKKSLVIGLVIFAICAGAYGWWSISKATKGDTKKLTVKYDTGDKPMPQTVSLWVNADGGLNMRSSADSSSKTIILIPNGTSLSATQTSGNWYQVTYMNKTGWVAKQYVTTSAPAQSPTVGWQNYQNTANSYSLQYPNGWVVQDYGANPASGSTSYVAFGPQLAAALDPNNLPPVILRIVPGTADAAAAKYKSATGSTAAAATISGLSGTEYTYTAASGVQMTAYVVAKGPNAIVIEESGGYSDQLAKMVASLNLG